MKTAGKPKPTRKVKPSSTRKAPSKKKAKSKIILTSLAVGAVGILGYLAWQFYTKKRASKYSGSTNPDLMTILPTTAATAIYPSTSNTSSTSTSSIQPKPVTSATASKKATSSFPLKKGHKNEFVKNLQLALISKYGASILPKYGADGDFGSETVAALAKAGLPATIDESTYYVVVQGNASVVDNNALANKFLTAAVSGNFNTVLALLKQLKNKEDYKQVSEIFVQYRLRGVRQTLVNGLLNSFTNEKQKEQIRYEFIRMGLKYDGKQWSLDGFDGRPIVTTEPTNVWISATENVGVQASVVLGAEVSRKLDYTLFENGGKYFLVATKSIRYL